MNEGSSERAADGWVPWARPGTAVLEGSRLRALAVARDDTARPVRVRVQLAEDLGIADAQSEGRETTAPASREVVLPLSDFEPDPT